MNHSVFYEMEFILLVVFSLVIPVGIYGVLYKRLAISRWTVVGFAILLIIVSGIDVVLLQSLSEMAKGTEPSLGGNIFSGQISLTLYLLPAVFAGLGVNLISHVLVNHLNEAEKEYDKAHRVSDGHSVKHTLHWPRHQNTTEHNSALIFLGSVVATTIIFVLDFYVGANIRLHVLYVFPLAMVARHCPRLTTSFVVLIVTTTLQIITFSRDALAIPAFLTDVGVALVASLLLIYLARAARSKYLLAVDHATTDALTGLANRRAFIADLESEITRQKRYGGVFSLAVLDLDGFKALNDSKGHFAGDEALKLMADILRDCTRGSDAIGRIGGDEFAIMMLNTQDANCEFLFHELCKAIATRMADAGFAITASIGCKTFRVSPENTSDALQQADEIMYEAKHHGKNCAVLA